MGTIVDVKSIVEKKKQELKNKVDILRNNNIVPKLAVIIANNEDSSRVYVSKKRKMCEELGIEEVEYILDESVTNEKLLDIINRLNEDSSVDGILLQLPIYKNLDEQMLLNAIDSNKDVDGFHILNVGKLACGQDSLVSCTPKGIMMILDTLVEKIDGLNAVVVGRSQIVGKPMAQLLLNKNTTITICHSKTNNLTDYTKMADILVVAVGYPNLITKDMVKENSIVIDVGINRLADKLVGDVDTQSVVEVAKYVTPVPGGVGLTTVVSLMDNLVSIAQKKMEK